VLLTKAAECEQLLPPHWPCGCSCCCCCRCCCSAVSRGPWCDGPLPSCPPLRQLQQQLQQMPLLLMSLSLYAAGAVPALLLLPTALCWESLLLIHSCPGLRPALVTVCCGCPQSLQSVDAPCVALSSSVSNASCQSAGCMLGSLATATTHCSSRQQQQQQRAAAKQAAVHHNTRSA
jgi:hypothetical protein